MQCSAVQFSSVAQGTPDLSTIAPFQIKWQNDIDLKVVNMYIMEQDPRPILLEILFRIIKNIIRSFKISNYNYSLHSQPKSHYIRFYIFYDHHLLKIPYIFGIRSPLVHGIYLIGLVLLTYAIYLPLYIYLLPSPQFSFYR